MLPPFSPATLASLQKCPNWRKLFHLRNLKDLYTERDVPVHLKDTIWANSTLLQKTFPRKDKDGKQHKSRVFHCFPRCMLERCQSLRDRMIVINFWLNLSKEHQKHYTAIYQTEFVHFRKSGQFLAELIEIQRQRRPERPSRPLASKASSSIETGENLTEGIHTVCLEPGKVTTLLPVKCQCGFC